MTDSLEHIRQEKPFAAICAGGYILRQREWAERGNECLEKHCPYPDTCEIKNRAKKESEQK